MTKPAGENWAKECLDDVVTTKIILFVDSWGGQRGRDLFAKNIESPEYVRIETIPPKTTGLIQPLDVYFSRQYKLFTRKIEDAIRITTSESFAQLNDNKFILQMHGFIHNNSLQ